MTTKHRLFFLKLGLAPDNYRCLIPECHEDSDTASVFDFGSSIFWQDDHGTDYCRRYPLLNNRKNTSSCSLADFNLTIKHIEEMIECDPKEQLVIYGGFDMISTVVTEFNLVCKEDYKVGYTILISYDINDY